MNSMARHATTQRKFNDPNVKHQGFIIGKYFHTQVTVGRDANATVGSVTSECREQVRQLTKKQCQPFPQIAFDV